MLKRCINITAHPTLAPPDASKENCPRLILPISKLHNVIPWPISPTCKGRGKGLSILTPAVTSDKGHGCQLLALSSSSFLIFFSFQIVDLQLILNDTIYLTILRCLDLFKYNIPQSQLLCELSHITFQRDTMQTPSYFYWTLWGLVI